MKAVTIIQPWATLVALRVKTLETRSWATKHRGAIAIHAGQKVDKEACLIPQIREALLKHGINDWSELPTGAVIAKGNLNDVWTIERPYGDEGIVERLSIDTGWTNVWGGYMPNEYHFGDYSDGRFAWQLDDVVQLQEPVPAKGQLSLWNWEEVR
ncbi:ASCH domain-containing protein [Paenibacillus barcinonensis]|uniref:ASCH domain-containing protein n=1 Tax=Paenibacillus barcinonensis TaxID=198119 RepID=A0A2V4VT84_PAEBA|nr:ASCH domain-containing protein [Paenibacillus barcinonensis]PYE49829.1 ASCH domain-containing protein [Paenibacillus barcinonensis]QKS56496.1 ASCH domain-containing protein [Paenibacillus barcinonensis]